MRESLRFFDCVEMATVGLWARPNPNAGNGVPSHGLLYRAGCPLCRRPQLCPIGMSGMQIGATHSSPFPGSLRLTAYVRRYQYRLGKTSRAMPSNPASSRAPLGPSGIRPARIASLLLNGLRRLDLGTPRSETRANCQRAATTIEMRVTTRSLDPSPARVPACECTLDASRIYLSVNSRAGGDWENRATCNC